MIAAPAIIDYEAEAVRSALLVIAGQNNGVVAPSALLDAARSEQHPLHHVFEWDDGEAAEKFRLLQAGALIRKVRVNVVRQSTDTKVLSITTTRAFEAPHGERKSRQNEGGGYGAIEDILRDPPRRSGLLASARAELAAVRKKYELLDELAQVWSAIDAT